MVSCTSFPSVRPQVLHFPPFRMYLIFCFFHNYVKSFSVSIFQTALKTILNLGFNIAISIPLPFTNKTCTLYACKTCTKHHNVFHLNWNIFQYLHILNRHAAWPFNWKKLKVSATLPLLGLELKSVYVLFTKSVVSNHATISRVHVQVAPNHWSNSAWGRFQHLYWQHSIRQMMQFCLLAGGVVAVLLACGDITGFTYKTRFLQLPYQVFRFRLHLALRRRCFCKPNGNRRFLEQMQLNSCALGPTSEWSNTGNLLRRWPCRATLVALNVPWSGIMEVEGRNDLSN